MVLIPRGVDPNEYYKKHKNDTTRVEGMLNHNSALAMMELQNVLRTMPKMSNDYFVLRAGMDFSFIRVKKEDVEHLFPENNSRTGEEDLPGMKEQSKKEEN